MHFKPATKPENFALAIVGFVVQSKVMESNWAAENLQTIRTLMERSAVYRRALAPIMLFAGALGVVAAGIGLGCHLNSMRAFGTLWLGTAIVVVAGTLLIARRQAFKDREPFWSPPTRRVAQALLPPLTAGMCLGVVFTSADLDDGFTVLLALLWVLFYGCGLHAAGFFAPRGVKLLGWAFIACACLLLLRAVITNSDLNLKAHWLMGFFFGGLHLAYGAYLYLTGKGKNAA